jgi:sugar transferase EpsL
MKRLSYITKAAFDRLVALMLLIALSPVLAALAFAIRLTMGRPVLFRQARPGRYGKLFTILKFRTMESTYDSRNQLLPDEDRLTRVGRLLRTGSMDELPQLFNVLKGDMSLVGPRPLLPEYLRLYTQFQSLRHDVKPGITGWAQVNGRNGLSWEEKLSLDAWYVEHRTFWLDWKILWLTFRKILRAEGISQCGHATMPKFKGQSSLAR